ncbi:hypothetical protein PO909_016940 [Leuciscus waleckii]
MKHLQNLSHIIYYIHSRPHSFSSIFNCNSEPYTLDITGNVTPAHKTLKHKIDKTVRDETITHNGTTDICFNLHTGNHTCSGQHPNQRASQAKARTASNNCMKLSCQLCARSLPREFHGADKHSFSGKQPGTSIKSVTVEGAWTSAVDSVGVSQCERN